MASKKVYYLAAFVGSTLGSFIPALWGAGFLTYSSVLFSAVGGVLGIIIVFKYL